MIWRFLLPILFTIFGIQFVYSTNKFESYKKFNNENLETQHQNILGKLSSFDTINVKTLNDSFYQESVKLENDYYINLAISNYVDYYFIQGDLKSVSKLYEENINHPKTKHLLSYILLLSKFYHFYYNYGAKNECEYILNQIYRLKDFLPHKEKLYATAISYIYDGLVEDDANKFELKKNLLLEAIQILEYLKKDLSPYEYKVRLSSAYNHLAICYLNNRKITDNLDMEFNISEMEHAASLLRKAIRINNDNNLMLSAIYKSNLAFVNNMLDASEDAIYYGNKSMFLANKIKNKVILLRRSACNVADTYMFNNLMNSISYIEAYKICNDSKTQYLKDKQIVLNNIKNINHPKEIFYEKHNLSISTIILGIIGILILFLGSFFILKKFKNNKVS